MCIVQKKIRSPFAKPNQKRVLEYHLVYLMDIVCLWWTKPKEGWTTLSSSAFRMFFKFVCPDLCGTKHLFPHLKWVFKPKNFFINKGERTDQEEKKKGSSSNTKHSAKALLETHMDTPQPEDTLSDMIQLKYENPLFYLTWNTFLEVEAKPRQRGWLMVQLVHSHEFNASMWGE